MNAAGPVLSSALLTTVVALAQSVLHRARPEHQEQLHALLNAVKARHARPSEHPRRTHYALMMMEALDHVLAEPHGGDAADWASIAAALLPFVQRDIMRALDDERAVLADTH